MHSIQRERRRILAGILCLVLVMLFKLAGNGCKADGTDEVACSRATCARPGD